MSKHYIYSTLTSSVRYTEFDPGNGVPIPKKDVIIYGGAGIPDKQLVTPFGVMTEVDDEQLEFLKSNDVFKMHVENGFVKVSEAKSDVETVVSDMEQRDVSAPLVPGDFVDGDGNAKPIAQAVTKKKKGY